ncbi:MAG: Os1348 family NHLP clan protein [Dehalococcoidia bacterium]
MTATLTATKEKVGEQATSARRELLAVIERAASESEFLARLAEDPHEALKEYYSLTMEERAALASGDIRKVESWVGKLDQKLATWLWSRLSQEKW